jgi:SNF2 family DNA or RNA helicase
MFKLKARHRLPMSGTLSGDKPQNFWSALHFAYPKQFSSYWKFYKRYVVDEIDYANGGFRKFIGVQNIEELHDIIRPFYIRHLKMERCCDAHPEGAMPWLGEKLYDTIWVDLVPAQRRVYEEMRKSMVAWVGEHEDTPLVAQVAVAQMVRLSQMALAMPLIGEDGMVLLDLPSTKADAILEVLEDHPDQKFVICSSSTKFAYLLHRRLGQKKIASVVLSGDTPDSERHGMVARFATDENQAFIGVIKAMGEGIDGLQHATSTMIFADRDWSAMWNKQCEDRIHRDGQRGQVQIIDVMARNTVDLGRQQKLVQKWSWILALLNGHISQVDPEVEE